MTSILEKMYRYPQRHSNVRRYQIGCGTGSIIFKSPTQCSTN